MLLRSITPFGVLGGDAKAAKKTGSPPFAEAPELLEQFSHVFSKGDLLDTKMGKRGGVERGFAGKMFHKFTVGTVLHSVRRRWWRGGGGTL